MAGTKQEVTGWRDLGISKRHREWGVDLHATDIDFMLLEHWRGDPAALIEYKAQNAEPCSPRQSNMRALITLGTNASLPVFGVRYKANFSEFTVSPLNKIAKIWVSEKTIMDEKQYSTFLHNLRGLKGNS